MLLCNTVVKRGTARGPAGQDQGEMKRDPWGRETERGPVGLGEGKGKRAEGKMPSGTGPGENDEGPSGKGKGRGYTCGGTKRNKSDNDCITQQGSPCHIQH